MLKINGLLISLKTGSHQNEVKIGIREIPAVTKDEIKRFENIKRGKASREANISFNLLNDTEEIAVASLLKLFTKCFEKGKMLKARKTVAIILIHKQGDVTEKNSIILPAYCQLLTYY